MKNRIKSDLLLAVAMALFVASAAAREVPDQLPDPDGKPADQSKPVKVFILMGQSNMLDFGRVGLEETQGTLTYLTKKEGKYPEFKGNVKTVDARPFWSDQSVSPNEQGYHYNQNAETYMEVGNALGMAMTDLLDEEKD